MNRTSDEIRRRRWNWIGHILRKNREEHCVTALEWRPEGRRRPSRPKTTWRRMVEDERRVAGWQLWTTVRALAANRRGWKENVKAYSMCLTARRDIESLIFIWQMIALSVGKLKLLSPASENVFVESLDQFRRLAVREKVRSVFVMSLRLSDHQGITQHQFFDFFPILSLFSVVFRTSKLLAFKEFIWQMIALSVGKLKLLSPASENVFVESLDQFRRLAVREKVRSVFVMSLRLSDHQGITQHQFFDFFPILSLFSVVFRTSKLLAFKEFNKTIIPLALRASLAIYHLTPNARSWNNC